MANKKAEMGVGTLIVFIAMLLVAAVAAGVLIQTAGSLQEKSLSTGQQARSQISTNARVIEVSATDGRNGNLTDFQEIIKLSPGSDPIKLSQIIFTFNTKDHTSTLKYKGTDCECHLDNSNGYNTWNEQSYSGLNMSSHIAIKEDNGRYIGPTAFSILPIYIDLDQDGIGGDYARTCRPASGICDANKMDTFIQFNLTNRGAGHVFYLELIDDDGTAINLTQFAPPPAPGGSFVGFNITNLPIDDNGTIYGYITARRAYGASAWVIDGNGFVANDPDVYFELHNRDLLNEDLDLDGGDDYFATNETHAIFYLSSLGPTGRVSVSLGSGVNLTEPPTQTINLDMAPIQNSTGGILGYLTILADSVGWLNIPDNGTITITPYNLGQGYFAAVYEQEGTNHVAGNLQRGDIVKLCYESPGQITEDDEIRLNFIPKIGTPTLTQFVTPDVISTERVYLYP